MAFKGITAWLLSKGNGSQPQPTGDYTDLEHKPAINGHE